jgi:hypothetical protein
VAGWSCWQFIRNTKRKLQLCVLEVGRASLLIGYPVDAPGMYSVALPLGTADDGLEYPGRKAIGSTAKGAGSYSDASTNRRIDHSAVAAVVSINFDLNQ